MVHIDPIYSKDFCAHYPAHNQAHNHLAITQCCILINMLQALIKAEAAVTNILEIVHVASVAVSSFIKLPQLPLVQHLPSQALPSKQSTAI
jgi:hypothetical protein